MSNSFSVLQTSTFSVAVTQYLIQESNTLIFGAITITNQYIKLIHSAIYSLLLLLFKRKKEINP